MPSLLTSRYAAEEQLRGAFLDKVIRVATRVQLDLVDTLIDTFVRNYHEFGSAVLVPPLQYRLQCIRPNLTFFGEIRVRFCDFHSRRAH